MVKAKIRAKNVELLYHTGSQFSIITKQTYDSLSCKPPLVEVKQNGIDIGGHKFSFKGVAYLDLSHVPEILNNKL